MEKPFFSVIVPVYNAQQYLEDCVNSVLSQDTDDYELILADDGSTDQSGVICDALSKQDERIKVFHKDNGGQLQTRLFGLNHANGRYCIYLDADDYLDQGALKYLKSVFSEKKCDCIVFGYRRVKDNRIYKTYTVSKDELLTDKHEVYRRCLSSNIYNSMCRKSFRIDLYRQGDLGRYFHLRKGEDLLQSLDLLRCCNTVYFSKEVLYNYRINEASITNQRTLFTETNIFPVSEYVLELIMNEARFSEAEQDEYRGSRFREFFLPLIFETVRADIPMARKKKSFQTIRRTEYYQKFLSKRICFSAETKRDLCILLLFRYGFDSLIIFAVRTADMIRKKRG